MPLKSFIVLILSVVRKSQAPRPATRAAAARCLRGGERPVRRHRASASGSVFERSFAGPRGSTLAARFAPTPFVRLGRSLFELSAFLPCSLVTAPRVAFVGGLLMPTARSSLGALVIGGGGGASSSCYRRVWKAHPRSRAFASYLGVFGFVDLGESPVL